ncbi:MAG: valine--pyruvate transaminase [Pseudomonadota bacterium]|jgi:valine--pyruvate aminotransferase|nr:valine--pyruvate transaminase [Pseudomonadota bacterium]
MNFSNFGQKFIQPSGISQLMDDLGDALKSEQPINMLGGGNPARIDAVNRAFLAVYKSLAEGELGSTAIENIGNYSNPKGDAKFIDALVDFLNRHYDWGITKDHIALTNGSQNAFFYLFNLFGGQFADGKDKSILLPLAPEYIGYSDVHIAGKHFVAVKPIIEDSEYNGEQGFFKYHVDFDALNNLPELKQGKIGAICCSRPTNPTGNVLTDEEMAKLSVLAKAHDIPLIIDNAYGMPFPNIIHTDAKLTWDDHSILCTSLSKIGLPGTRTGIIVADPKVVSAVSAMNAIVNLSPTRFGTAIATPLLESDELKRLADAEIQPFYQAKANFAVSCLKKELANYPMKIHQPEGAIFLWIWFQDLPINTVELYQRLKAKNTLIIPSEHFFPGIDTTAYSHAHECIRMSIAQDDATLEKGIAVIGEVVRGLYDAE